MAQNDDDDNIKQLFQINVYTIVTLQIQNKKPQHAKYLPKDKT